MREPKRPTPEELREMEIDDCVRFINMNLARLCNSHLMDMDNPDLVSLRVLEENAATVAPPDADVRGEILDRVSILRLECEGQVVYYPDMASIVMEFLPHCDGKREAATEWQSRLLLSETKECDIDFGVVKYHVAQIRADFSPLDAEKEQAAFAPR